ncbi:baseplate J/gp47 family protein [Methylomonas sp. EFPC1]|uniref:baseplate J/gp47 family protein n=1 Tax=Methylomonas sp. EFPC1 TaxID=2812647 RepID=UPI0019688883|nr:baseplate J/gp47 family protein [Methylomonas sp. EFPC1]QSB01968.1 baseplate J/gp47 family protein [Methylomonas sp. EFPC1]
MDFTQILKDNGIPTTQAELESRWRDIVASAGTAISNDSIMSPFWRFVTAAVTNPVLWLVNFIAVTVMPNAYVKYAVGEFLELLADAVNLFRKQPTKTKGAVTFVRVDTGLAITVPINTVVQTATINGKVYQVKTTEAKSFVGTNTTLAVPVEAVETGSAYNLAANYYNVLPVPIIGITAVANGVDWISSPGTDVETDDALRARIRNQFGTASSYHTDSVYRSLIAQFPGVAIDAIWFEHNAPRGPGTANAYVLFDFSAPVSTYLLAINQYITDQGNHGHGDDLIVYQMPEQTRTLTATVWVEKFLTTEQQAQIDADVTVFINAAFRENQAYKPTLTYPYSRFSFSKLSEDIHAQFPAVHSVSFSLTDIVTTKWIPRLTSLTVTVQETE